MVGFRVPGGIAAFWSLVTDSNWFPFNVTNENVVVEKRIFLDGKNPCTTRIRLVHQLWGAEIPEFERIYFHSRVNPT